MSGVKDRATEEAFEGAAPSGRSMDLVRAALVEEARSNGLLAGEKSIHVSFRAPPALIEAARRETGVTSLSELGTLALLALAMPDPVAALMKRTRGRLGRDHTLDT